MTEQLTAIVLIVSLSVNLILVVGLMLAMMSAAFWRGQHAQAVALLKEARDVLQAIDKAESDRSASRSSRPRHPLVEWS